MREITMPEVKLPDIRLPEGLREMSRDDIVQAAHDVRSSVHMPKKIDMPDIDLSKVDLPKQLTDRLPQRRRRNPLLPIAGVLAVGAMIAGIWFLFTSSLTGPRVRSAVSDLKQRVTGERTDLVRYDQEEHLDSLLADPGEGRSTVGSKPYSAAAKSGPNGTAPVGSGTPEGIGQPTY